MVEPATGRYPESSFWMHGGVSLLHFPADIQRRSGQRWIKIYARVSGLVLPPLPGTPVLPDYGSLLWEMVFQNITNTLMRSGRYGSSAVLYWRRVLTFDDVAVQPDANSRRSGSYYSQHTIAKRTHGTIWCFPFYIQEGRFPMEIP